MYHIDRGAWAEINLDAVAHNVQIAKSNLDPHTKLCAVVKADAYGHGAVAVAREAEKNGADFLAVALLQEGLELREAGIRLPILVLGSLQPGAANVVVQFDISHAVFDEERLYALNEAAVKLNKKARIHIAIDTGMHRIGVHVRDAGEFAAKAAALPGIEIEGVFSHFATADADDMRHHYRQAPVKHAHAARAVVVELPVHHLHAPPVTPAHAAAPRRHDLVRARRARIHPLQTVLLEENRAAQIVRRSGKRPV